MQLVMKSLRKSFAGSASSLTALEPLLREWSMLLDTLEGHIECHILRALDLEFQLGRAVDGRTLAELRSAASEMAQICTEVANVVRRLQGDLFQAAKRKGRAGVCGAAGLRRLREDVQGHDRGQEIVDRRPHSRLL